MFCKTLFSNKGGNVITTIVIVLFHYLDPVFDDGLTTTWAFPATVRPLTLAALAGLCFRWVDVSFVCPYKIWCEFIAFAFCCDETVCVAVVPT